MADFSPRRIGDRIYMYLSKDMNPTPMPVEIQPLMTAYNWDMRVLTIKQICNQFSRPTLERIWFFFAILTTIFIPLFIHSVIFNALHGNNDSRQHAFDSAIQARYITLGIFIALVLLLWVPPTVWKYIGNRRVNAQLNRWAAQDNAANPHGFNPLWRVEIPGTFTPYGKLSVTLPPPPPATVFHPNAYMPPYLAPPGYNYYPPTSYAPPVIGYNGPVGDEKRGFEEVDMKDRV